MLYANCDRLSIYFVVFFTYLLNLPFGAQKMRDVSDGRFTDLSNERYTNELKAAFAMRKKPW